MLWAGLVAVAFTAGALAACSGSDETEGAEPGTRTAAPTTAQTTRATPEARPGSSPVDATADSERAEDIPLDDNDVPEGWNLDEDGALTVLLGECAGELAEPEAVAIASGQEYSANDRWSFASTGVVLGLISDAPRAFDALNGPDLQGCVLEQLPDLVEAQGARVSGLSVSPFNPLPLGEKTGGARYVVALDTGSDPEAPGLVYDVLWVLNGREIAGMVIGGSGSSRMPAVADRLFRTLGAKIGAAPNEGVPEPSTTSVEAEPEEPVRPTVAAAALEDVVRAWYEDADPAVCDHMTDGMLDFGWGATGEEGRAECRANLEAAEPAQDVAVKRARIGERRVTVEVSYATQGGTNVDRVTFVRRGEQWLINRVRLVGFE